MNEEEKKAFKVINTRTRRLLDELEIEKEDMSDEPKIAYLMQEIRANKTILNLIEKLQKENEEIRIKNNAIKRESEAYLEYMIRLDNELNLEKEKSKYEWIRQNCLSQELVNKLYIPIQKIKDKIRHYQELQDNYIKKYDEINEGLQAMINVLQELLEGIK